MGKKLLKVLGIVLLVIVGVMLIVQQILQKRGED